MLHEKNASVLSLLPSLGPGLIERLRYLDSVLKFIKEEKTRLQQSQDKADRLQHIENQLSKHGVPVDEYTLAIDEHKSLLLAYAFGEIYTPALALLSGKHISVKFWGTFEEPWLHAMDNFIGNPAIAEVIFFEVSNEPCIDKRNAPQDLNPFLHLREMLLRLGLLLNLSTFDLERLSESPFAADNYSEIESKEATDEAKSNKSRSQLPRVSGSAQKTMHLSICEGPEKCMVDPINWFCSCMQFTEKSFVLHDSLGTEILAGAVCQTPLDRLFQAAICRFPKKLPMCKHLLAVLLMLLNWGTAREAGLVQAFWVQSETAQIELNL